MYTVCNVFPLQPTYVASATYVRICYQHCMYYVPTGIVYTYYVPFPILHLHTICMLLVCWDIMHMLYVRTYRWACTGRGRWVQSQLTGLMLSVGDLQDHTLDWISPRKYYSSEACLLEWLLVGYSSQEKQWVALCIASLLCSSPPVYPVVPLLFNLGPKHVVHVHRCACR